MPAPLHWVCSLLLLAIVLSAAAALCFHGSSSSPAQTCHFLWRCSSQGPKGTPPRHISVRPPSARRLPPFFSWEQRRTGVTPQWQTYVGTWAHYDPRTLQDGALGAPLAAKSQGRIAKNLRQLASDDSSFELWSVLEPDAFPSDWVPPPPPRAGDGLVEIRWIFRKARWRLTRPAAGLVLPRGWPPQRAIVRATIVRPDAATFSGTLYLPRPAEARRARGEPRASYELGHELWLAEGAAGAPEAIKHGLVYRYNALTGAMFLLFRCRELLLPGDGVDPNATVDWRALEAGVAALDKADREAAASPEAQAIVGGAAVSEVVAGARWRGQARVLRYLDPAGQDVAWEAACEYYAPGEGDERYLDLRWPDGVYARVPRRLDVFDGELSFEVGRVRIEGGMQRLLVLADRARGGVHTLSHEVYS